MPLIKFSQWNLWCISQQDQTIMLLFGIYQCVKFGNMFIWGTYGKVSWTEVFIAIDELVTIGPGLCMYHS